MNAVFATLAVSSAIAATVLAYIFIIPESKKASLNGFLKKLHDFLNFKTLLLEVILKGLYIFATALCLFLGFFGMFDALINGNGPMVAVYLGVMIGGPISLRLTYETFMMFIILVKNVGDINKKVGGNPKPQPKRCPHCGATVAPSEVFCNQCGQKV